MSTAKECQAIVELEHTPVFLYTAICPNALPMANESLDHFDSIGHHAAQVIPCDALRFHVWMHLPVSISQIVTVPSIAIRLHVNVPTTDKRQNHVTHLLRGVSDHRVISSIH